MYPVSEELSREQKYFDAAWDHRERMRTTLGLAAGAAANSGAAARIRQDTQARLNRIGGSDEPVAFGRMDYEDGEVFYIGHHAIFDDHAELLVMNWQAPAAARYYEASHADPFGLRLKRNFECSSNTITSFSDTVFAQLAADVAELEAHEDVDDALLADLNSNRTGTMQDIVRTIQAAQFDLIRAPMDQLLVIQGGPGTGKTAVALHRVSWLLFNSQGRLSAQDVLIIGPSPTFTRYTRTVLPSLGDTSIEQRDINQLHPPVKRGRREDPEVVRLKGDGRMAGLVRRALYARVGPPEGQHWVEAQIEGRPVPIAAEELKPLIARCRASAGTYSERRHLFRDLLTDLVSPRVRVNPQRLRTALDPVMDRLWPSFTAASFLRELYGSRDRLMGAAGDEFTAREVSLLHRRPADRLSEETWSDADLSVLDEAEHLINSVEARFTHIVVDEAQDLSPMQLRAIARRSANGSMTIVGDVAQSTGHWARDDWDELLDHLPADLPQVRQELRYGYRVPRQVFELAAQLLPLAAPTVQAPQIVRDGPAEPLIHRIDGDERAAVAVRVAMGHASHGRSVAIICPTTCRPDTERELKAKDVAWRAASAGELGPGINLVGPQEAKGLEFDAVVVMEPEDIVAEDDRGHRLLYVALTRTTRYLDIVCVGDPLAMNDDDRGSGEPTTDGTDDPSDAGTGDAVDAEEGSELEPDPWGEVLDELLGSKSDPAAGSDAAEVKDGPHGGPRAAVEPSNAPQPRGHVSQRFVDLAAEEVVALLRETVAPNLWKSVLARAGEVLDAEG
ncbi:UvrD-helicase domain-containing protein [Micromonospora sp. NBC_00389]|uniref:HelD family protein n=1 Tax=Micromonospora sp. NBC_00389 TaxID=2903586 RepID=UPI002E1BE9D4